ncbi:hypothetical protein [Haloferula sp. BvORR071]|uniref:hypothetical protein n=1 Tax=Haloferula sp. BvORR071 TaxID=1396141 RepID=UPI002240FB6C|nr:hypothetical protein [Haloferula sp. BvORR071]
MKIGVLACWIALSSTLVAELVDVAQLPGKFVFTKGEVSLGIDPSGKTAGAFLVNDTGEELKNGIWESARCTMEAKIGGVWKRCQLGELECASGGPPGPIPPRKAIFLEGPRAMEGDREAELRYSTHGGAMTSGSFRGRYFSRVQFSIEALYALEDGNWKEFPYAHGPEEFIALVELERHYDRDSWSLTVRQCAETMPMSEKDRSRLKVAGAEALARPAPKNPGEIAIFERCVAALAAPPSENYAYGGPERCRPLVWRRLTTPLGESPYINPNYKGEPEANRASGNPWGMDKERLTTVVDLAIKALSSKDASERQEAISFLGMTWVREEHFPNGAIDKLLKMDAPEVRKAAADIRGRSLPAKPEP